MDDPIGKGYCIRAVRAQEVALAAKLWVLPSEDRLWSGDLQSLQASIRQGIRQMHVAEATAGRLIGAILSGGDGRRGYVYRLGVAAEWRGHGVARALATTAIEFLVDAGVKRHHITVLPPDDCARAFWEHLGYGVKLVAHRHLSGR